MAAMRHPNVVLFLGICIESPSLITEYCARGSLYEVIQQWTRGKEVRSPPPKPCSRSWVNSDDSARSALLTAVPPLRCIFALVSERMVQFSSTCNQQSVRG